MAALPAEVARSEQTPGGTLPSPGQRAGLAGGGKTGRPGASPLLLPPHGVPAAPSRTDVAAALLLAGHLPRETRPPRRRSPSPPVLTALCGGDAAEPPRRAASASASRGRGAAPAAAAPPAGGEEEAAPAWPSADGDRRRCRLPARRARPRRAEKGHVHCQPCPGTCGTHTQLPNAGEGARVSSCEPLRQGTPVSKICLFFPIKNPLLPQHHHFHTHLQPAVPTSSSTVPPGPDLSQNHGVF